ncbi:MAG: metallophosphoesterase family protein [Chloroflexia bacterium]|nr:metallophosphoesterase family protein [Chloroflexia bacterium]
MRCAVISDIHANLTALETVLDDIADGVEQIWCLGDVVGYGPDPNACVDRVRREDMICVVGNHDWASLGKLDLDDFNPDARRACLWTQEQLSEENREFLDQLPASLVIGEFTLVHGSPRAPIWEYITHASIATENFYFFDTSVCLVGHTHVPTAFHLSEQGPAVCERSWLNGERNLDLSEGRWILNPGGVGQPRDGSPSSSYFILDTEEMRVETRRVSYDIESTQERMQRAGLPQSLITRLSFGW